MRTMFNLAVIIVLAVMVMAGNAFAVVSEDVDKEYFDKQFNKLYQSVGEVKGETAQIVSILGTVFEGTVPSGGTLIGLCNQQGWNLIVLMGHNGISNPNIVSAGACFNYPQTAEEFQVALKKGKPLHDAWLKNQKIIFRVNRIKVDTAEIDELNIRVANIKERLVIKDMQIDRLKVRLVEISENLKIRKAEIQNLKTEKLRIKQLEIDNLKTLLAIAQKHISIYESRPVILTYNPGVCISKSCDEKSFIGNVPDAVLARCPNGADAVEVHERHGKKEPFKAKRIRVVAKNKIANPTAWLKDGSCMRVYSKNPLKQSELQALLSPGETLIKIKEYLDGGGKHKTIAVYLIIPQ